MAPGVFVICSTDEPDVMATLKYIEMGDGPNYALYRPYHLTSVETPLSIAKACIDHEPTIVPRKGLVAETINIDFEIEFNNSGNVLTAKVPFKR